MGSLGAMISILSWVLLVAIRLGSHRANLVGIAMIVGIGIVRSQTGYRHSDSSPGGMSCVVRR